MEGTTKKGEGKFWNFNGVKQKGVEHDFWLKFSGGKNLGGNYDKINLIAFVHSSNYIYFYFQKSNRLWQKHVKQNGIRYNECGNVTEMWLNNVQWRNNFIIENDTRNIKFIMFHVDDINSAEIFKRILRKIEWDSVDRLVRDTRTNFCESYLFRIQSKFWKFCKI